MQPSRTVALIGAGNVPGSSIGHLARLADRLGPVKASSFRVASRIANRLHAGRAVHTLPQIASSRLVLVCVPERRVAATIREMERSSLDWAGKDIVLCDSRLDTQVLAPLAAHGAHVASLNTVLGMTFMEGDTHAIRVFRRELLAPQTRIVRVRPGSKPLLNSGLTLAGLTVYLAAAAGGCLRAGGATAAQARKIVQQLMAASVRSYEKSGHKAVYRTWTEEQRSSLGYEIEALRTYSPELAALFTTVLRASLKFAKQPLPPELAG